MYMRLKIWLTTRKLSLESLIHPYYVRTPLIIFWPFYLPFPIADESILPTFVQSKYGTRQLSYYDHVFNRHVTRQNITYWRCSQFAVLRCRARIKTCSDKVTLLNVVHNHELITETRKYGSLKEMKRLKKEELKDSHRTNVIKLE